MSPTGNPASPGQKNRFSSKKRCVFRQTPITPAGPTNTAASYTPFPGHAAKPPTRCIPRSAPSATGRIAFLASVHSPFQMLDALIHVHVSFLFLRRLGVLQRRLGMLHQDIPMSLLAVRDGFFGVLDRFSRVRFGGPGDPIHDERQSTEEQHNNYKITHHDRHLLLERYPRPSTITRCPFAGPTACFDKRGHPSTVIFPVSRCLKCRRI